MRAFQRLFFVVFFMSSLACQASNNGEGFEVFWPKFREAALSDAPEKLHKFIQYPLEVRGVHDDMPIESYTSENIGQIFPKLLDQNIYSYEGDDVTERTFRDVIRDTKEFKVKSTSTSQRVEQFEFEKIGKRWMLVRAYLE